MTRNFQFISHFRYFIDADKKAKHIMTHRTEVEWVDIDQTEEEIYKDLSHVLHSKIICCKGNLDNYQGVLYLKDYYQKKSSNPSVQVKDLLLTPEIISQNADAQEVLNQFRIKHTPICFVINEYGGFEGIITLHDIIESIFGHIHDEAEVHEPDIFERDDNSVLVSGDAPIETLAEIITGFTVDFEKIDYSTVAGFVFNSINKIPKVGDKLEVSGHIIEIVDMDGLKIDKVLITKTKMEN